MYPLRYLPTGHVFINHGDNCDKVIDALLKTKYSEEFCLGAFAHGERDVNMDYISRLMEAGFLVMSTELVDDEPARGESDRFFILLPKLHLVRSVLFFPNLHIKKSIRPCLSRYELKADTDFNRILNKCIKTHGTDWLTPPLVEVIKRMRKRKAAPVKPVSFGLYRDGKLKAGEFGIVTGRVYTSYSGYFEEENAGTVQMILMARQLEKAGFDFLDFGMPLDYKSDLGAQNISPRQFVELFRKARRQAVREFGRVS